MSILSVIKQTIDADWNYRPFHEQFKKCKELGIATVQRNNHFNCFWFEQQCHSGVCQHKRITPKYLENWDLMYN